MRHWTPGTTKLARIGAVAILVAALFTSTALALPSVSNAFSRDFDAVLDGYASAFGWDKEAMTEPEWSVAYSTGTEVWMRRTGYQTDFLKDNITTTKKYLGMAVASGTGSNIVEVALNEVGREDSLEAPAHSNNVKYNTWYYGREVFDGDGYAPYPYHWCCVFVAWCAEQCGYLDMGIFTRTASCSNMFTYLRNTMGFATYPMTATTTFGGGEYTPVPGDILFFYERGTSTPYAHIGIIVEEDGEYIHVVEGNTTGGGSIPGGGVALNRYRYGSSRRVDDGFVVHVEYPDNRETIFNFVTSQLGYNAAAASGVLANIEMESGFKPDIEEIGSGIGYGLCQWSFERRTNLERWCVENGYNYQSLDGQLWFMKYELEGAYRRSVHEKLLAVSNDAQGAYDAGYVWCYSYEVPAGYNTGVSVVRGNLARSKYWPEFGIGR